MQEIEGKPDFLRHCTQQSTWRMRLTWLSADSNFITSKRSWEFYGLFSESFLNKQVTSNSMVSLMEVIVA